jgi:hypothetical protein
VNNNAWIKIIAGSIILAILVIPVPEGVCQDGGTRSYTALTYKIVVWNRLMPDWKYEKTTVYWFPRNFQSIDTLWEVEMAHYNALQCPMQ